MLLKPHSIWFVSQKEKGISVRYVSSPFHPRFDRRQTYTTQLMNKEFHAPFDGLCRSVTNLGWKGLSIFRLIYNFESY